MDGNCLSRQHSLSLSPPNFPNFLPIDFIFKVTKLGRGEGSKRSLLLYTARFRAMESDARVSGAWNADTCSGKTRLSSRCAPCACRIHNSASAAQPEARCRRVSKIIWPSDFEHAGFLLLPLCFLRVDRSREEGCCARFKFFLPLGRVRELFSLFSRTHARTHTHDR